MVPCKVIVLVISGPCEAGDQLEHFLRCSRYISHVRLGMDWVIVISPELTYFSADKQDYQVYWSDLNSLLGLCGAGCIISYSVMFDNIYSSIKKEKVRRGEWRNIQRLSWNITRKGLYGF